MNILKNNVEKILLILLLSTILLRFIDLGYSEYITDETTVVDPLRKGLYSMDFFLDQKKGPMQFIFSNIPYLFTKDVFNEFVFRLPFALANIFGIFFFFKFISNITDNKYIAFVSSFLFSVNGFIVAFGRVVQYQSLNILFSSLSLYFYSLLLKSNSEDKDGDRRMLKNSLIGTLFFSLSLLSHWDAVFILPVILYIFVNTLIKKFNFKIIVLNILLGCILLLPFLIPYISNYRDSLGNQDYMSSRVGINSIEMGEKFKDYKSKIFLYNPLLFLPLLISTSLLGILSIKKSWLYVVWFIYSFGIFIFLVKQPGTHVYNMLVPLFALSSFGIYGVFNLLKNRYYRIIIGLITFLFLGFLYYQSYVLIVDHNPEYPWYSKMIFNYKIEKYSGSRLPNNAIGFPLRRNWEGINDFINSQGNDLKYITNEDNSISEFYMDADYAEKKNGSYYAIGIKHPLSFVTDYKFSQIRGKKTIHKIKNESGDTLVRIYLVDGN